MFPRKTVTLIVFLLVLLAACAQAMPTVTPSPTLASDQPATAAPSSGAAIPTTPEPTEPPEAAASVQESPISGVADSPLPTRPTSALDSPLTPTDGTSLSPLPTPVNRNPSELDPYFEGYTGCFIMLDVAQNQYTVYNPEQCAKRLSPCSTFKIPNSLIGLETGVIPDQNYLIEWDGTIHPVEAWNRDHTLATAIQNSVVWYYQELARRVGEERMQSYVSAIPYGNQDISSSLTEFWLAGSLEITAEEQISFLQRLINNDLPFSQRSMDIVKEIIILDLEPGAYNYRGKTGSCMNAEGHEWGWFVGYVSQPDNQYIFAANIEGSRADGFAAKAITEQILVSLRLIDPQ